MAHVPTYSLAPGRDKPRRTVIFCDGWRFHKGDAVDAHAPGLDDAGWEPIVLPHCFNAEDTFTPSRGYYRGPAWYRKRFAIRGLTPGRRAHLVLEGSFAVTDVWLNGRHLAHSVDGYTGMSVDLTDAVVGGENVLAIRVDNSHDPDVLPGREDPDYNLYGGIYREASLVGTNDVYVPRCGLRIATPQVTADSAHVEVSVHILSTIARDVRIEAVATDANRRVVARAQHQTAIRSGEDYVSLPLPTITNPRLWSPDAPHLYTMAVAISTDSGLADRVETCFGLRWFEFDIERGFFLNGEHLRLVGVNRHQDFPGLGNALPPRLQRADAELIKAMGANFARLSHYPQHPAFLDACDELGICAYQEIASWQFIGRPKFHDNAVAMMRAMIRRDANHPSIMLWGLFNEGRSRELFQRLHNAAHEEDPSRPTIYAENNPEKGIALETVGIPDVLGINYEIERLDEVRAMFGDRRLLSSEHANSTTHDLADWNRLAEQSDRINAELDVLDARPWMAGSALWSMHDYGTDYEPSWPIQRSGALDECRRPKESFWLLCARWCEQPMVRIEGHWNQIADAPMRRVRVYTNCDRVSLRLNGFDLGERTDGFIRTWEVAYEPGCLEAVGVKDGIEVRDELRTHGAPAKLILDANAAKLVGPGDACWLTARLLDAAGAPVLTGQHEIEFGADGPVVVRGAGGTATAVSIRGIARIALQALGGRGEVVLKARAAGIESNEVRIRLAHRQ
jgi:beta-galactosidase